MPDLPIPPVDEDDYDYEYGADEATSSLAGDGATTAPNDDPTTGPTVNTKGNVVSSAAYYLSDYPSIWGPLQALGPEENRYLSYLVAELNVQYLVFLGHSDIDRLREINTTFKGSDVITKNIMILKLHDFLEADEKSDLVSNTHKNMNILLTSENDETLNQYRNKIKETLQEFLRVFHTDKLMAGGKKQRKTKRKTKQRKTKRKTKRKNTKRKTKRRHTNKKKN